MCLLWRRVWAWLLLACVSVNWQQHVLYRRQMSRGQRNGRPHCEDHPGVLFMSAWASLVFDERKPGVGLWEGHEWWDGTSDLFHPGEPVPCNPPTQFSLKTPDPCSSVPEGFIGHLQVPRGFSLCLQQYLTPDRYWALSTLLTVSLSPLSLVLTEW